VGVGGGRMGDGVEREGGWKGGGGRYPSQTCTLIRSNGDPLVALL